MKGKRVTVAGLGHFGGSVAAARWLVEQGANVLVTDTASPEKLAEQCAQLEGLSIEFRLGEHRSEDFTSPDLVVASPAIPPSNQYLQAAHNAGVPVTTEICLLVERCPARIFAVTGTKGKSTAATLLHRMLSRKFKTWLGGNIGGSLLPDLPNMSKDDVVVLELSSFMLHYLDETQFAPSVAVVTMLAADHIEWHGSLEAYTAAKAAITRHQTVADRLILDFHSPRCRELADISPAEVIWFGNGLDPELSLRIPGKHNQRNAQAALAAAQTAGITVDEAQQEVVDFAGLPHRLELVHESGGIRFFDDSIATIPQAAVAALGAFEPKTVIQIVGGCDHGLDIFDMCSALTAHSKAVLCIGATGAELKQRLGDCAHHCIDLKSAMHRAKDIAARGDVVLLSTGYKSFDQFTNYEQRGFAFTQLAREIF